MNPPDTDILELLRSGNSGSSGSSRGLWDFHLDFDRAGVALNVKLRKKTPHFDVPTNQKFYMKGDSLTCERDMPPSPRGRKICCGQAVPRRLTRPFRLVALCLQDLHYLVSYVPLDQYATIFNRSANATPGF